MLARSALALFSLSACATSVNHGPSPAAAPVAARAARRAEVGIADLSSQELRSQRQLLSVSLPDLPRWKLDDASATWLVATHAPSASRLRIRGWAAPRLVRPEECEAQARRWDPSLPEPLPGTVIDRRALTGGGFRGWLTAFVDAPTSGGVTGDLLAFGAAVGRCVAVAYTTACSAPGADFAVARRLALIADVVLPSLRGLRVEDRATPLSH